MDFKKICINCMKEKPLEGGPCPYCGFNKDDYSIDSRQLLPMTPLNGKYILGKVLGIGGFGITYLALDTTLQINVAIKELFIKNISKRGQDNSVQIPSNKVRVFEENKKRFLQEAKILATFDENDGVVNVKEVFEENNTAYIVMEYLPGNTLKERVKHQKITYDEVKILLDPIAISLKKIHQAGVVHLDVSPNNIMSFNSSNIKLLDFGGAMSIGSQEGQLPFKKGYSPLEQRLDPENVGAWTDVYAFAATIYYCLTGIKPVDCKERKEGTELEKPSKYGVKIPKSSELALMKALELKISDRYKSIDEFWSAFSKPKQKKKIGGIFALVALAIALICGMAVVTVVLPAREKAQAYEKATELLASGEYLDAYDAFEELGDYKDSLTERKDIKENHPLYFKEIGDEIVFGTYPQTAEGRRADVEWIILNIDRENHHIMLLSKYALERKVFHDINENISWADSTLRFWLNNEFIDEAFSGSEQKALLTHSTGARDNWEFGTPGGVETDNKVYLLDLKNFDDLLTDKQEIAQCMPTEYAIKQGAEVKGDYCNWWLRSPGEFQNYAAIVDTNGGFINSGRGVTNDTICVRPVIWIDISVLDKN